LRRTCPLLTQSGHLHFSLSHKKLPPGTQPGGRPERHFMISLGCNRKGERCLPIAVERMVGPQYLPVRDTKVPTKTFASRSATRHCASKTISLRYLFLIVSPYDRCFGSCDGNALPNLPNVMSQSVLRSSAVSEYCKGPQRSGLNRATEALPRVPP
jgi:hypothetical protein